MSEKNDEDVKVSDETVTQHSRLDSISSKKLVDICNVLDRRQSSSFDSSAKIYDIPDVKYTPGIVRDLDKHEYDLKPDDFGPQEPKYGEFERPLEECFQREVSSISVEAKEALNATVDAVCEQVIIDDVKATLHRALDEISKKENAEFRIENQEIVVHVGSTTDIQGLGIKIIPKVPDVRDLLSDVRSETEKSEIGLPPPEVVSELPHQPEVEVLSRWMAQPPAQPNCPYGLEFLSVIDTIRIAQTKMLPFFSEPSFIVNNNVGQYIYEVDVRTNCFSSFVCASKRSYEMSILNGSHIEVMHFTRPSNRHGRRSLEVYAPFDTLIGKINEGRGSLPYFIIMDSSNEVLFRVEAISGPPDSKLYTFGIMPTDGDSLVGKIRQETSGTLRKVLRENCITINFYINLDAKIKALIMGCGFLIDLMFLEIF